MRALDRYTIDELGIPGEVLMESAGRSLVDFVLERAARLLALPGAEVVVVCGLGSNGGDGFVAARHLLQLGIPVRVLLLGDGTDLRGDAALNYQRALRVGVGVERFPSPGATLPARGVLIDAIFGTGLSRPVEGAAAEAIEAINRLEDDPEVTVIAVDLPSGLDADTGRALGHAVIADATLTIGTPKIGLALEPGRSLAGQVSVARIGIADSLPGDEDEGAPPSVELWSRSQARAALPERRAAGHKGSFGHVLLLAGSEGMSGAAALAAKATLRSGAGLVTLGCPAGLQDVLDAQCSEAMTVPLPAAPGRSLDVSGLETALALAAERDVVAMGPGLGRGSETRAFLQGLAAKAGVPLVIDADGLNAFEGSPEALRVRQAPTLLTPHPGEAGRLLGCSAEEINLDRVAAARELAGRSGAVVLLKGPGSVVADPDGSAIINATGGSNLATGGSGDVLTGLVAALLAQGSGPMEAAALGAYVHGLAGDRIARRRGSSGLLAGELVEELPEAMQALREGEEGGTEPDGHGPSTLPGFP
jgi:NAD(P)H-hydrate epimerase